MAQDSYWRRTGGRAVTRRRTLAFAGGAAFLAACGGDKDEGSGSSGSAPQTSSGGGTAAAPGTQQVFLDAKSKPVTGKEKVEELRERFHPRHLKQLPGQKNGPKNGGTLRFASNVPVSWDLAGPAASLLASYRIFHNGLVSFEMGDLSENLNLVKVEPDLAQSWEQPDKSTYTFKLTPGVKWANVKPTNGRALKAEDVKYSIEVYQKAPVQSVIYRDVERVETPDDTTVVIKMKQPVAYLMGVLMQPHNMIFAREQHESSEGLKGNPVGTGAFIFEGGEDRVGWRARKNPDYFKKDKWTGKQLPYLDRIETKYFADTNASLAAFRDKQLDTYYPVNRSIWLDLLKTNPEVVTQITTPPPSYQPYMGMRVDKPPFNDVRVRRALSMGINRDDIIFGPFDGMAGLGYAQDWSYFGQEWPWTAEQVGPNMKFDVAEAKKLLQAAGFSSGLGRQIEMYHLFNSPLNEDVGRIVADNWRRNLGIDVKETQPADSAAWTEKLYQVKYDDIIIAAVAGPSLDPDAYAYDPLHSKSSKNYFKVNDSQLDQMTEAQRVEFDLAKRQKLLKDIMARDLDQMYRLWTITPYKINSRYPYVYNAVDQIHAWGPIGWGAKVLEYTWLDK
jgi:peptide/nickel transport system substrate-binding protein